MNDLLKNTETEMREMKIEKTKPAGGRPGKGYVLYGENPDGVWVEKWFPTLDKAIAYCEKRNLNHAVYEVKE